MKIILVIQHGKVGGIEQHVFTLAKELKKHGLNPIIVMLFSGGPMIPLFEKENIQYYILNGRNGHDITMALRFRTLLKKEKPSIIHMHATTLMGAIIMWTVFNIPFIITEHMAKVGRVIPSKTKLIYILSHFRARKIIAVSESTRQSLLNFNRTLESKVLTMYNGIEISLCETVNLKKELSLDVEFLVGAVGRLDSGKGWETFIKTAALVNKQLPTCHFVIIGDGPMRGKLESLAIQYDVKEHIHFLGFRNDVRAILGSLDLYLLLSEYEACPLSLLEAMAEKVPVAGFMPIGGVEEINNGIYPLLKQRDTNKLVKQIVSMLLSKADVTIKRETAFKRVTHKFDSVKMSSLVINIYNSVLQK